MKTLIILVAMAATACATTPGPREIQTQDVAVTHVERAVTAEQVRNTAPPPPMAARPASTSAALDLALAKLCEYVGYADRADVLLQHAAGFEAVASRVVEPICQRPR